MSHSENPYDHYDGESKKLKSRNDLTPCTISGSSSENNLYASAEVEPSLNKGYSSEVNLDSMHLQMGQIAYQQQYKASLRRKCKEGGLSQEIYSKLNRSIAGDTARNYSNQKLELLDFYEESPSRNVALEQPEFREMREHYMVPTHDPSRVSKKSLSLFNPQFLPNFNDMIMYVAQGDAKNSRQFYPNNARLQDNLDFMKPSGYRNDAHGSRSQTNVDPQAYLSLGYPQNSAQEVTNEDIFILKRELRESTWKDKYDLRDCTS